MKNPLSILLLALWGVLGYFYYQCHCQVCHHSNDGTAPVGLVDEGQDAVAAITNKMGPLMSKWGSAAALTGDGWEAMKGEITNKLGKDKILEIIGYYRKNEVNNTSFENLGIARAHEARKLLADIPESQIRYIGKLVDDEVNKDQPFVSHEFDYKINNENIKEIEDEVLIYFPYNSTNKLKSAAVEAYLNDVADRVKKTGESITLTGHTDSDGSDASNLQLGQRRADIIKNYLISRGVDAAKITATSAGESQPKASNDTNSGKAENRRTVLKISK